MILNLMLGKQRGGLEQAAIDYAQALTLAGIAHHSMVPPDSWAAQQLATLNLPHSTLAQRGGWDPWAAWSLRRHAQRMGAHAIICHGNRALSLALLSGGPAKKIAVAHNYQTKRFARADAVLAITHHAITTLTNAGIPAQRMYFMPNMVRTGDIPTRGALRQPPVIGSMGRFVAKKGFLVLLDALAILRARGVDFHAVIGGDGEEYAALAARIAQHDLQAQVTLSGWVADKNTFLQSLDIFVLPSYHEPFGIVLLEAMAQALPIVSTAAEGPREILSHGRDGLLTPCGDAAAMADAIAQCLANHAAAQAMGRAAYMAVGTHYSMNAMATRLQSALSSIIGAGD